MLARYADGRPSGCLQLLDAPGGRERQPPRTATTAGRSGDHPSTRSGPRRPLRLGTSRAPARAVRSASTSRQTQPSGASSAPASSSTSSVGSPASSPWPEVTTCRSTVVLSSPTASHAATMSASAGSVPGSRIVGRVSPSSAPTRTASRRGCGTSRLICVVATRRASHGPSAQPFSAPALAPWVKNRWNTTNTIATGMVISRAAAILIGNWLPAPRLPDVSPATPRVSV